MAELQLIEQMRSERTEIWIAIKRGISRSLFVDWRERIRDEPVYSAHANRPKINKKDILCCEDSKTERKKKKNEIKLNEMNNFVCFRRFLYSLYTEQNWPVMIYYLFGGFLMRPLKPYMILNNF